MISARFLPSALPRREPDQNAWRREWRSPWRLSRAHLGLLIERHIEKRAVGTFAQPGFPKIRRVRNPAPKARTMISPRTDACTEMLPISCLAEIPNPSSRCLLSGSLPTPGVGREIRFVGAWGLDAAYDETLLLQRTAPVRSAIAEAKPSRARGSGRQSGTALS